MRVQLLSSLAFGVFGSACSDYPDKVGAHQARAFDTTELAEPDVEPETDAPPDLIDNGVGLPCEVERLLVTHCRSCHGATPTGETPMSLVTRQDMLAPGRLDPTRTIAQLSVTRMRSATKPMPPPPGAAVPEDEVAAFESWVQRGVPSGDCEPIPDPFVGPVTCTSGRFWSEGDDGSPRMFPGRACIDCHTREDDDDAPSFAVAGTLYPTGREPNDCDGTPSTQGFSVVVTDAVGRVYTLQPNRAGNFFLERRSSSPFT